MTENPTCKSALTTKQIAGTHWVLSLSLFLLQAPASFYPCFMPRLDPEVCVLLWWGLASRILGSLTSIHQKPFMEGGFCSNYRAASGPRPRPPIHPPGGENSGKRQPYVTFFFSLTAGTVCFFPLTHGFRISGL